MKFELTNPKELKKQMPESVPSLPSDVFSELPDNEQAELVTQTYNHVREILSENGFSEAKNITEMYGNLPKEKMIVRREDPEMLDALFADGFYPISFATDSKYANCVEWTPSDGANNIRNAYLEGYSQKNSVVAVVGIRESDDLIIQKLDDSQQTIIGSDRGGVRLAEGVVTANKLLFVSLRMPISLIPESELTEDELDDRFEFLELKKAGKRSDPVFVHRGFIRNTVH